MAVNSSCRRPNRAEASSSNPPANWWQRKANCSKGQSRRVSAMAAYFDRVLQQHLPPSCQLPRIASSASHPQPMWRRCAVPCRAHLGHHELHAVLGESDGLRLELEEDAEVEGDVVPGEVLLEILFAPRVPLDWQQRQPCRHAACSTCRLQRRELLLHSLQLIGRRGLPDPLGAQGIHGKLELPQILHPAVGLP
eukprot:747362-Hanusia_phi.AAC.1